MSLQNHLNGLRCVLEDRLRIWRGALFTLGAMSLFGISTFIYGRIHGFSLSPLWGEGEFRLPHIDFIEGDGFTRIAVEVAYWSSLGVIIRWLNVSAKETQTPGFDLIGHFNKLFTEWVSVPIMSIFVVYVFSVLQINLDAGIALSIPTASIGFVIALSFILGFLGSEAVRYHRRCGS